MIDAGGRSRDDVDRTHHASRKPLDDRRFRCPQCKQKTGVNIIYGYPTEELWKQSERNEVALGGCVRDFDAPDRQCLSCQHQWQIVRRS